MTRKVYKAKNEGKLKFLRHLLINNVCIGLYAIKIGSCYVDRPN